MLNRATKSKEPAERLVLNGGEQSGKDDTETLNFKVRSQFKREYKGYAVSRGITMVELLEASYQLYRVEHDG